MTRAWRVCLIGFFLAPVVTFLPMVASRWPWIGLPRYDSAAGVDFWQNQAFWLVALGVIAAVVMAEDRWLGGAVLLAGLNIFWRGAALDPTHSVMFALGALVLLTIRRSSPPALRWFRWSVVGLGAFQALYAVQQWLGYDLLWGPLFGGTLNAHLQPFGTLGSVNATMGVIAIATPLMPVWAMPAAALIVWQSHSLGAVLALLAGLMVLLWQRSTLFAKGVLLIRWPTLVITVLLVIASFVVLHKDTQTSRYLIWQAALGYWVHQPGPVIFGYGLGGWQNHMPALHQASGALEYWREAHNEYIQWLCETGVAGTAIFGGWVVRHWRMIQDPVWGASVAALAIDAMSWFPFHIVTMALLGLIVVGCATRSKEAVCVA
jgi:hypothetical protein